MIQTTSINFRGKTQEILNFKSSPVIQNRENNNVEKNKDNHASGELLKVYFLGKSPEKVPKGLEGKVEFEVNPRRYPLIDKKKLDNALRKMGKKYQKKLYRDNWTPERPTTGYCSVVAEVIYHYLAPKGSVPQVISFTDDTTHWYVKTPDGALLDQTGNQFDFKLPYEMGRGCGFMTKDPSKRAKILAVLLGLEKLEDQKPELQKEIRKIL